MGHEVKLQSTVPRYVRSLMPLLEPRNLSQKAEPGKLRPNEVTYGTYLVTPTLEYGIPFSRIKVRNGYLHLMLLLAPPPLTSAPNRALL